MNSLGRADIHIHTTASDGLNTCLQILEIARRRSIDVIAITDHNTIEGAQTALELANEDLSLPRVVIGEEVSTREGHILGLFLTSRIERDMSAKETILAIHEQDGLAIAAHPFWRVGNHGLGVRIENMALDALEEINGTPAPSMWRANLKLHTFNRFLHKPVTGGSDAHACEGVGYAYTLFPGDTPLELKEAILKGTCQPARKIPNPVATALYIVQMIKRDPGSIVEVLPK